MIDYAARLVALRGHMAERNIGLLYLPPGANLFYLTGIRRHEEGGTDHNAYGDYVAGGYIGLDGGVCVLAPRMGGGYFRSECEGKPWIESVRLVDESESPEEVQTALLKRWDLRGKALAADDRTWAKALAVLRRALPDAEPVLASEFLAPMRMIKSDEELALMRRAGQIAEFVFQKALARLKLGVTEWDIASEIDYQFKAHGAEHTSFVTGIFFAGEAHDRNTVTGRASEKKLTVGDSVMFDFGCVFEGYCSDFGRSAFVGEPPAEYLQVHALVLESQRAGIAAMKADQATGAQVNAAARKVIDDAGYGQYFTHRVGHGIGITVHEPPWLDVVERSLLRERMTFTVEPSVIVPDRFGNRVEDVVVVTPQGGESLYTANHDLAIIV